jgi:hypothetical protein
MKKLGKSSYIALLFSLLLVLGQLLIMQRQRNISYNDPPDLKRMIDIHPDHWQLIDSNTESSPSWKNTAGKEYDLAFARTYSNESGQKINIIMTWSRDGIRRAGHVQQLCYSAGGASVNMKNDMNLDIDNKNMTLTSFAATLPGGVVEDVLYWRITGGFIEQNRTGLEGIDYRLSHRVMKMQGMVHLLFGKIPDNIMVRVSSVRLSPETQTTAHLLYIKEYLQVLSNKDKSVLMGL